MKASFDDIQKAFVEGRITLGNLLEILIDNFGEKKAFEIIQENLKIAQEKENSA